MLVVIPVYNDFDGLLKTIDSIKGDLFVVDVLIVDDGSSVPVSISNCSCFINIIIIRLGANSGIEAALNVGFEYAIKNKYKYVSRIDAGDFWVKGRLEKQIDAISRDPSISLIGGAAKHINEAGDFIFMETPPVTDREIKNMM